jgi:hypothetical protein
MLCTSNERVLLSYRGEVYGDCGQNRLSLGDSHYVVGVSIYVEYIDLSVYIIAECIKGIVWEKPMFEKI